MKVLKIMVVSLLIIVLFTSCNQDDLISEQAIVQDKEVSVSSRASSSYAESPVSPKFGKPNVTNFVFQVYDVAGVQPLSVKFFERATGIVTYVPMVRIGSYWRLTKTMINNGWFDCRYVFSSNKLAISATPSYELCSTYNTFNSAGTSSLRWPFGADRSSWNNGTVYVNGKNQKWVGGNEFQAPGNGFGQGAHTTANGDYFGDDWNRGSLPNDDLGAELRSPLDGTLILFNTYNNSYGVSRQIAVQQIASDGKVYKFFFNHLDSFASGLYLGMPVKAGITKLGTLGKSGASAPHAHCSFRNITNGANTSIAFSFNAQ